MLKEELVLSLSNGVVAAETAAEAHAVRMLELRRQAARLGLAAEAAVQTEGGEEEKRAAEKKAEKAKPEAKMVRKSSAAEFPFLHSLYPFLHSLSDDSSTHDNPQVRQERTTNDWLRMTRRSLLVARYT